MYLEVSVEDAEVRRSLAALAAKLVDMTPAAKAIGEVILSSVERNFEAGGRPTKWKESLRVKTKGGQTLSDTGRLRRSFTAKADRTSVSVGTDVKYAPILQMGGKTRARTIKPVRKKALFWPGASHPVKSVRHPGAKIPARPFLMIQKEDWTEINETIKDYLGR